MGLQKYRADYAEEPCRNGAVAWRTRWVGGPTLALVRNCPVEGDLLPPRTVYVRGEPDTFFSVPAACRFRGQTITGWLGCQDGEWLFHVHTDQRRKLYTGGQAPQPENNDGA